MYTFALIIILIIILFYTGNLVAGSSLKKAFDAVDRAWDNVTNTKKSAVIAAAAADKAKDKAIANQDKVSVGKAMIAQDAAEKAKQLANEAEQIAMQSSIAASSGDVSKAKQLSKQTDKHVENAKIIAKKAIYMQMKTDSTKESMSNQDALYSAISKDLTNLLNKTIELSNGDINRKVKDSIGANEYLHVRISY